MIRSKKDNLNSSLNTLNLDITLDDINKKLVDSYGKSNSQNSEVELHNQSNNRIDINHKDPSINSNQNENKENYQS